MRVNLDPIRDFLFEWECGLFLRSGRYKHELYTPGRRLRGAAPPMPTLSGGDRLRRPSSDRCADAFWQTDARESAPVDLLLPALGETELESCSCAVPRSKHAGTPLPRSSMGLADVVWPDRRTPGGSFADGVSIEQGQCLSSSPSGGRTSRTGTGRRATSFIEGCPAQWYELPEPADQLTVSLDGGYVHTRSKDRRKDDSFEVIVSKSMTGEGTTTSFGLISGYDPKPRRRLLEALKSQGMQMN